LLLDESGRLVTPLLQLSNLDCHDAASHPPRVGEVEVSDPGSLAKAIVELEKQMKAAAKRLEVEDAAHLRDRIKELRAQQIYKA
jgi:excinuclease UvrABC helicase subunit UvrB